MLVNSLVPRLAHTKSGNIVGFESTLARDGVMMGSVLPVRRKVRDLEGVDCCGLVARLDKALKVGLPVVVQSKDVICVTTVISIKALAQKVNVSRCGFNRRA